MENQDYEVLKGKVTEKSTSFERKMEKCKTVNFLRKINLNNEREFYNDEHACYAPKQK